MDGRVTWGSCEFVLVAVVCWDRPGACQSKTAVSCSSPRPHQDHNGWSAQCHQLPWTEAAEALGLWGLCDKTVTQVTCRAGEEEFTVANGQNEGA